MKFLFEGCEWKTWNNSVRKKNWAKYKWPIFGAKSVCWHQSTLLFPFFLYAFLVLHSIHFSYTSKVRNNQEHFDRIWAPLAWAMVNSVFSSLVSHSIVNYSPVGGYYWLDDCNKLLLQCYTCLKILRLYVVKSMKNWVFVIVKLSIH